jgi:hypothetical protein
MDEDRDYLEEARRIIAGKSLLMPERAHLISLQDYYESREYAGELINEALTAETTAADAYEDDRF